MDITLTIERRTIFLYALAAVLFGSIVFVRGFNSGGPASFVGHSSEEGGVPPGAVMFFNLTSCPNGYVADTTVRGRTVVGLPAAGTLEGTTGTALTNLENRPVGAHSHGISDPGHSHSISDPGHTHSNTLNDPGHFHTLPVTTPGGVGIIPFTQGGPAGNNAPTSSDTTGITINNVAQTTGISINSAGTGISVNSAGAVAGTNAPYVQYLACVRQ